MATAPDRPSFPMRIARDLHVVAFVLWVATTVYCAARESGFVFFGGLLVLAYGLLAWGLAWGLHRVRPRSSHHGSPGALWHGISGVCLMQGLVYTGAAMGLLLVAVLGRPCEPFRAFSRLPSVVSSFLVAALVCQGPLALVLGLFAWFGTRDGRVLATALWVGALPFVAALLIAAGMALAG